MWVYEIFSLNNHDEKYIMPEKSSQALAYNARIAFLGIDRLSWQELVLIVFETIYIHRESAHPMLYNNICMYCN